MSRKKKLLETAEKEPSEAGTPKGSDGSIDNNSFSVNSTTKKSDLQEETDDSKDRTRNFAFLVYPDSAPEDWREILTSFHVEVLISPLHDKDVNPDGSQKKPHWHVMVMFSSVKTKKQAAVIRDAVGGVGWENVASARGYARYLCHLDNPEKHRYDENDVVEMGGADYQETIRRIADGVKLLREMMDYIRENNVYFYSDFVDYCNAEKPEWFEAIVTRYTYTVYTYIKARGKKLDRMERWGVDPDTGEVR